MQRSPCHECIHAAADKNIDDCLHCDKRTAYVAQLEGRSGPVPMGMTDMGSHNPEKTRSDDQFMVENPDMPPGQIAAELGRSVAAINVRRSRLNLTRKKRLALDGIASEKSKFPRSVPDMPNPPPPPARKVELVPSVDLLLVNVREFEDLYEGLKRSAKENFRTPELQALWFIHRGLAAEDGACDQRRHIDGTS